MASVNAYDALSANRDKYLYFRIILILLVIKDSYANAFVSFLLPHYKEIYIADPRQFKYNVIKFIQEKGIQEVIFLNYVSCTSDKGFSDLVIKMMDRGDL